METTKRRSDTRERIQTVALELFAEQGYEKTSLREIAERLGVTKAALYYHFKTKEDILASIGEEFAASVDAIVAWGREQPATLETRQEILRKYAAALHGRLAELMRCAHANQTMMRDLKSPLNMRAKFTALRGLLSDADAPVEQQLRASVAIVALHAGMFGPLELDATDAERREAALNIALDLLPAPCRPAEPT